ncbi:YkoF family thiamine/hydroxymethylpyrimidine-binding protein [Croceiramulus getboli]|nr:YkoF family thiamine/hydroxymethylpyrimidine-binding protein [Flavobacteriaceae bacterium YJPT1-3]
MDISVELTLSPLQDDFEPIIIAFIKKLRSSGFKIVENALSTQVFGPYDAVMDMLQKEMKTAMEQSNHVLIYMKLVKSDRSQYEPHF